MKKNWEEEFDEKFGNLFVKLDENEYGFGESGMVPYLSKTEDIKQFIHALLSKQEKL